MSNLVIGGPEKYDATFVDWPTDRPAFIVLEPLKYDLDESTEIDPFSYPGPKKHMYHLRRIWLSGGSKIVEVWVSEKINSDSIQLHKYIKLLTKKEPSPWRSYKNNEKITLEYSYNVFGKWEIYHSVTMEFYMESSREIRGYNLIKAQQEMRFYKVERVDQTAEVGSGNS